MNTPGYEQLAAVLQAAYDQASKGKGAERHADSKPFHEQPMQTCSDLLGTDAGLAFQAIKKIREGSTFTEFDRFERELLGAINYIAGMIIWRRRQLPGVVAVDSAQQLWDTTGVAGSPDAGGALRMAFGSIPTDTNARMRLCCSSFADRPHDYRCQRVVPPQYELTARCDECGTVSRGGKMHYATCSKLTAPEGFVEQVEATFDELENRGPAFHCGHCGVSEGSRHHPQCSRPAPIIVEEPCIPEPLRSEFVEALAAMEATAQVVDPWAGAPEWAKYKAQDDDGEWRWFDGRPTEGTIRWHDFGDGGKSAMHAAFDEPNPNWRDTLIERTTG